MRIKQYKFKFYLNAKHAIYQNEVLGTVHPHTWEITMYVSKADDTFVQFQELQKKVEEFINSYQDRLLNAIPPFDVLNPTLENCCSYFSDRLAEILNDDGWNLLMMEMSDSPSHSFVISMIDDAQTVGDNKMVI